MAGTPGRLISSFENRFRRSPDVYRAPGRVNLIGEHTDYNGGLVCPIAIDLACYAASAPNRDNVLRVYSRHYDEWREFPVGAIPTLAPSGQWTDYIVGVARQLKLTRGYDLMLSSEVPVGSGLSSSAAIEVAAALALGWVGPLPSLELAQLCRRAENDFVGLPSGIMDQYASIFGREHSAILLDCRSLDSEPVPLPEVAIVAVNSMVKHELAASAYRTRVAECAAAAQALGVDTLRDATDPGKSPRARHVLSENHRVLEFAAAARAGDLDEMGRLLVESHRSLQNDYEVSCPELDFLVDTAIKIPGVYGARLTGGGFGGCTVNLMRAETVEVFEDTVRGRYEGRFGFVPEFYRVQPAPGASRMG
ncbi:MAG: galactokinase [Acidobacteriota bacterium]|nr:galactokinase [Acidobacteriota bacterium]